MSGTDLVVITPSRGRPRQLNELAHAVAQSTRGRAVVVGLVDVDDPKLAHYRALPCVVVSGTRKSLSGWTNHAAHQLVTTAWSWLTGQREPPRYLASLGDDHRPLTPDWDRKLIAAIEAMDGPGWAYGDDGLQGANMPTAWVQSSELVRGLGWMMLPTCRHFCVDNVVLYLGTEAGRLAYVPDVRIEHLHPVAGKAAWDDTYSAAAIPANVQADRWAFTNWRLGGLAADARTVQSLRFQRREQPVVAMDSDPAAGGNRIQADDGRDEEGRLPEPLDAAYHGDPEAMKYQRPGMPLSQPAGTGPVVSTPVEDGTDVDESAAAQGPAPQPDEEDDDGHGEDEHGDRPPGGLHSSTTAGTLVGAAPAKKAAAKKAAPAKDA